MNYPHLVLVGFMGAGKSTIGPLLATKAGMTFVDLDSEIERHAGQKIEEIFQEQGEVHFRQLERDLLQRHLASPQGSVIAAGGGALENSATKEIVLEKSLSIWLDVSLETAKQRLNATQRDNRPLFSNSAAKLEILFAARAKNYHEAHLRVDANRPPAEVCEKILSHLPENNRTIWIRGTRNSYPCIAQNIHSDWFTDYLEAKIPAKHVILVSDQNVGSIHGNALHDRLKKRGFKTTKIFVPPCEKSKSLGQIEKLYHICIEANAQRDSAILALGGGMISDLAGFLAATFMRGLPLFLLPTTTLAAVDAAVGSKNAINFSQTKNLIGTFYAPQAVILDPLLLQTQDVKEHAWGFVEALKMSITSDYHCYKFFCSHIGTILDREPTILSQAIFRAIALKKTLVEVDEFDEGRRMLLNFGHTVGHAIESGGNFALAHGKAVGLGMLAETAFCEHMDLSSGVRVELERILPKLGVPINWTEQPMDIATLRRDKKHEANKLRFPVVNYVGQSKIIDMEIQHLEKFLHASI